MANKQVEISMAEWDVMNIIWDKNQYQLMKLQLKFKNIKKLAIKRLEH